ncbi:dTMP kinase [Candidatus Pelagibacter sp.]|nr:dTMP kinase [Candidatus Pelagibacter sp.]
MSKKPIIVFEGIEGTGKSYHIKKIANYLTRKKIKFIKIREPGGSENSEKIRKLILNNKSTFNKETDLLLYLSARSENIEIIRQNAGKKIILIDRFSDSTIAYQHYGMGVNLKFIQNINNYLLRNIKIDFTFLNTVNLSNMKKRLRLRKKLNRYDKFNGKFYEKVQNGFIKIFKKNPKKYIKINSNLDIDLNENIILNKINDLI